MKNTLALSTTRTAIGVAATAVTLVCWTASAQDSGAAENHKASGSLPAVYTDVSTAEAETMQDAARQAGFELAVDPGLQMAPQRQKAVNLLETLTAEELRKQGISIDPGTVAVYIVGGNDQSLYWFIEIPLPPQLKDLDGGTIRLIMQHETAPDDAIRIVDEHMATEADDDSWGLRGRGIGRYGLTYPGGIGDDAWILGDSVPHILVNYSEWVRIVDYRWLQDDTVLPLDVIRIYVHPFVTARVIIKD